jgi:predicted NAD/FAD-dependent oxidoreductase
MPSAAPIAIVGAGVSGLACAIHLHEAGVPVRVLEAAPELRGRVRIECVERALPHQPVGWLELVERELRFGERLFVCGDHRGLASLQGAFRAGRRAAEAVANALGVERRQVAS